MMELAVLVMALLVQANGRIIYPDEYASMVKQFQASNTSYGSSPSDDRLNVGGTFYPMAASYPEASIAADDVPAFTDKVADSEAQYWNNHVNNLLSRGVTKFTLDMDRAIHDTMETKSVSDRPNIVFSPLSIVSTLAMVLLGSAGVTFEQVSKILGLGSGVDISGHSEIVHLMLGLVFNSILARPNGIGPEVVMANGMFVQNGFPIRDEFKAISQEAYNNEVINLDFIAQASKSRQIINDWVKSRTYGKISSILDEPIDADTRLIIASALYFSGEWNQYFFPKSTSRKPFAVTPNESVDVDMMYNGGDFPFFEDKTLKVKILGLPYKGNATNDGSSSKPQAMMYVLLPTEKDAEALKRLENHLTTENLENMINRMKTEVCVLGLPRMKLSSTLNLNKALQSLGLTSLFDPRASNLGVLSRGYGETVTEGTPTIFSRFNDDDKNSTRTPPRTTKPTTKSNIIRYEDRRGGYKVEQWGSGVLIEKIPKSSHRKRSADRGSRNEGTRSQGTRMLNNAPYDIPGESESPRTKLRFVEIGDDKYRFDQPARLKRQGRPIDQDFVRFIESRKPARNYGLDSLRNSPNLANPGLFASDVLHKVEMDVTETGTTAAAVTSISIQRGGDIKRLLANRPFLFFIRHESTKIILFWGTVNKPTPNY